MVGNNSGRKVEGICCDVSDSGLKILAKESLPEGVEIQLFLYEQAMTFDGIATIVYTRQTDDGYILGLNVSFDC